MRTSWGLIPQAALKSFALTSGVFGRFSKGSTSWSAGPGSLAVDIWSAFNLV
jgi:hypothetical protein